MQDDDGDSYEERVKEERVERWSYLCGHLNIGSSVEMLRQDVIEVHLALGFKRGADRPEEWNKGDERVGNQSAEEKVLANFDFQLSPFQALEPKRKRCARVKLKIMTKSSRPIAAPYPNLNCLKQAL